uniref:Uncharacterized protein n=1 Tax=uncultured marine virus TaxID=186617 RepID=A0A0F7L732_9VIRU|nr:hypothetical protein [uncultured marine virus]
MPAAGDSGEAAWYQEVHFLGGGRPVTAVRPEERDQDLRFVADGCCGGHGQRSSVVISVTADGPEASAVIAIEGSPEAEALSIALVVAPFRATMLNV